MGPLPGISVSGLVEKFKPLNPDEHMYVRAFYMWMVNHIAFDSRGYHHPRNASRNASTALIERAAVSEGFSLLFKSMCDYVRIECVVVSGYARQKTEEIGKASLPRNRWFWNAVKIRNTWYVLDACRGAGHTDRRYRNFRREPTDAWMYTDRTLFALNHFPDDEEQQFLRVPISRVQFNQSPIVEAAASVNAILPGVDLRGKIRGRATDCRRLIFKTNQPGKIKRVHAVVDQDDMIVDYTLDGNQLYVDLPLGAGGSYPISLLINDTPAFSWSATITKPQKRR